MHNRVTTLEMVLDALLNTLLTKKIVTREEIQVELDRVVDDA